MLGLISLFAALEPDLDLKNATSSSGGGGSGGDVLLIVGVVLVLSLSLFVFVYASRKNRHGRTDSGGRQIQRLEKRLVEEAPTEGRRRKKRRRTTEEFAQRNPTLGETGGLPPLRSDEPVEPAP